MTTRVGFVGIGRMGNPMCRHILQAGFPLTVFDVNPAAVANLTAKGARAAKSCRELAAQSDVMIVMVTDDEQVQQAVAGKDGLLEGAQPGSVIAISSSAHPDLCRALAEQAQSRGVGLIDAPVARGLRGAEEGDLTIFAGGKKKDLDKCRPVFESIAKTILYMGEIGKGQITKTCNNLLHWAGTVACYETLQLGARLGIAPKDLREAMLAGSADSRTLRELHLIGMFWPQKDMQTALELAKSSQTKIPLMELVDELVLKFNAADLKELLKTGA
jgi:3-hydroxyisobutyrate dehydrogenase